MIDFSKLILESDNQKKIDVCIELIKHLTEKMMLDEKEIKNIFEKNNALNIYNKLKKQNKL